MAYRGRVLLGLLTRSGGGDGAWFGSRDTRSLPCPGSRIAAVRLGHRLEPPPAEWAHSTAPSVRLLGRGALETAGCAAHGLVMPGRPSEEPKTPLLGHRLDGPGRLRGADWTSRTETCLPRKPPGGQKQRYNKLNNQKSQYDHWYPLPYSI